LRDLWGRWHTVNVTEEERALAEGKALFELQQQVRDYTKTEETNLRKAREEYNLRVEREKARKEKEALEDKLDAAVRQSTTEKSNDVYVATHTAELSRRAAEEARANSELALKKASIEQEYKTFSETQAKEYFKQQSEIDGKLVVARAELVTAQGELEYVQKHIETIRAADKGVIEGLKLQVASLQKQLVDALDFGKVLVAKLPEVNLNDMKIVVEMPQSQNKGGGDKGKGGGEQKQ